MTAAIIIPLFISFVFGSLVLSLIGETNTIISTFVMSAVATLGIWLGTIYAIKYVNKTYVIKNGKNIVKLATIYMICVYALMGSVFILISMKLRMVSSIESIINAAFLVAQVAIFYTLSKKNISKKNIEKRIDTDEKFFCVNKEKKEKHKSTQLPIIIIFFIVPFLVISVGFFIFYKYGNMSSSNKVALKDDSSTKIFSTKAAFAVLRPDGSITTWGDEKYGGKGAPTDKGYVNVFSTLSVFTALKSDGSIVSWGDKEYIGKGAPTDKGYVNIFTTNEAFAALKSDGSITAWGNKIGGIDFGAEGAPTDKGYIKIFSNYYAFAALKADGSIVSWGNENYGGKGAPTDKCYINIFSTGNAFAALKADGSITTWAN